MVDECEAAVDALRLQLALERTRCLIIAHGTDEARPDAERRPVHRTVRGSARAVVRLRHVHDGHRRLRRDTARRTEQLLVQHDVAGNDDGRLGEIRYR